MLCLDNPFWRFSLKVYREPGVAAECLCLQDRLTIDVNMLLFCCWLGACRQVELSATEIEDIEKRVRDWRTNVVVPLRGIRKDIKGLGANDIKEVREFREQMAAQELQAEQIEQAFMYEWAECLPRRDRAGARRDLIAANLSLLLQPYTLDHDDVLRLPSPDLEGVEANAMPLRAVLNAAVQTAARASRLQMESFEGGQDALDS